MILIQLRFVIYGIDQDITTLKLLCLQIVAHEIGHNLNMSHDFLEVFSATEKTERFHPDGTTCTNINGIMDYYVPSEIWTHCSTYDFKSLFDWYNSRNIWCMERYTPDTTPPTTMAPTTMKRKLIHYILKFI